METERDNWEQMGAASGLFATLLFVIAFVIFLGTDPGGGNLPALPDITHAEAAPAFFAFHLNATRAQVLLNSIGLALFLWFLGSLWGVLRSAEGGPARGSATASAGALVGVATTLGGLIVLGTATLTTSPALANVVPALYVAAMVPGDGCKDAAELARGTIKARSERAVRELDPRSPDRRRFRPLLHGDFVP